MSKWLVQPMIWSEEGQSVTLEGSEDLCEERQIKEWGRRTSKLIHNLKTEYCFPAKPRKRPSFHLNSNIRGNTHQSCSISQLIVSSHYIFILRVERKWGWELRLGHCLPESKYWVLFEPNEALPNVLFHPMHYLLFKIAFANGTLLLMHFSHCNYFTFTPVSPW